MSTYKTDQENFWAGEFGSEYINRNQSDELLASNLAFFSKALSKIPTVKNCIEFGANVGMNLRALKLLFPNQDQYAIEINSQAVDHLRKIIDPKKIFPCSMLEFSESIFCELVFIKGVLIHINPNKLPIVYEKLYRASNRYILLCEYYNQTPVSISYRGHEDRLFKRDFAGEMLDLYPDLKLLDYGFVYSRDVAFPQDDITWFLMEKRS
jgi:pseudaminic acid biosynthesis-associated methylase